MNPPVTVCLSVFNGAPRLPAALQSVRAQSFQDYKILVIDDGSTDDSAKIAEEFGAQVIRQENAGLGAAREELVLRADTPLIAFIDDDDAWLPTKLEVQVEAHLRSGAVLSHTGGWWVYEDGRREFREIRPIHPTCSFDHVLPQNLIMAPSVIFDRQAMLEAGNFSARVRYASDWYGWLKLARMGEFLFLEEPLLLYQRRAGQNTSLGLRFVDAERRMLEEEILGNWETLLGSEASRNGPRYRKSLRHYVGALNELVGRHHWVDHRSKSQAIRFALRAIRHDPLRRTAYTMIGRLLTIPRSVRI